MRSLLMIGAVALSPVLVPSIVMAQPAKVYVEGGPRDMKEQVLALLRGSTDLAPVTYARHPEANIDLQKKGGAKVKCGNAKTFLPGPTAAEIVAQFRAWLPTPLAARRAEHAARADAWTRGLQAFAEGMANQSTASSPSHLAAAPASNKLMLFGGQNHKVYLGCLNCSKYELDSVTNTFGQFGSKYAAESIFNKYSEYGGRYSMYSPCNPYAIDPPVIVDGSGLYYGRLTVTSTNPERTSDPHLRVWIAAVCAE
jgi:hypothetical protein